MMGKLANELRLPLHPMTEAPKAKLRALLEKLGIL